MKEKKVKLSQEEYDYIRNKIKMVILPGNLADDVDSDDLGSEIMKLFSIDKKLTEIETNGTCFNKKEDCHTREFYIEVKQNKEDMEEKKLNLKPFDIQKAREGKPVCTRDGRKVRIISCSLMNKNFPIAAIVEGEEENVYQFEANGVCDEHDENLDLMMLPEKKEGWINIYDADTTFRYVDGRVFETKDEAVQEAKEEVEKEQREKNEYIDTIRVEWEE